MYMYSTYGMTCISYLVVFLPPVNSGSQNSSYHGLLLVYKVLVLVEGVLIIALDDQRGLAREC